jgi:hypothetical protein
MSAKPLIEAPAWTPRSPVMVVGPVLVTVEAPRTAKFSAEPSIDRADARGGQRNVLNAATTNRSSNLHFISGVFLESVFIVFSFF